MHLPLLLLLHQPHLWSSDIRFWRLGTLVLEVQDTVVEAEPMLYFVSGEASEEFLGRRVVTAVGQAEKGTGPSG